MQTFITPSGFREYEERVANLPLKGKQHGRGRGERRGRKTLMNERQSVFLNPETRCPKTTRERIDQRLRNMTPAIKMMMEMKSTTGNNQLTKYCAWLENFSLSISNLTRSFRWTEGSKWSAPTNQVSIKAARNSTESSRSSLNASD